MITLVKAGIITGIIFAGFIMITIGLTTLPNLISNYDHDQTLTQSDEELEKMFMESREYVVFSERFPDHVSELNRRQHDAEFQMGDLNPDTGNALILELRYDEYRGMDKNAYCDYGNPGPDVYRGRDSAHGVLVQKFIATTKCLD